MTAAITIHGHGIIDLGSLAEWFQTRFQSVRLQPPGNEVLAAFLARRRAVPKDTTKLSLFLESQAVGEPPAEVISFLASKAGTSCVR
jgi:hypothetical protein